MSLTLTHMHTVIHGVLVCRYRHLVTSRRSAAALTWWITEPHQAARSVPYCGSHCETQSGCHRRLRALPPSLPLPRLRCIQQGVHEAEPQRRDGCHHHEHWVARRQLRRLGAVQQVLRGRGAWGVGARLSGCIQIKELALGGRTAGLLRYRPGQRLPPPVKQHWRQHPACCQARPGGSTNKTGCCDAWVSMPAACLPGGHAANMKPFGAAYGLPDRACGRCCGGLRGGPA